MQYEQVKGFIESHPEFTGRKSRYGAMALYFNQDPEVIKEMMSFDRYLRTIWPIDEIGEEKEKLYHKSDAIHTFENETNQLFKPRPITEL